MGITWVVVGGTGFYGTSIAIAAAEQSDSTRVFRASRRGYIRDIRRPTTPDAVAKERFVQLEAGSAVDTMHFLQQVRRDAPPGERIICCARWRHGKTRRVRAETRRGAFLQRHQHRESGECMQCRWR